MNINNKIFCVLAHGKSLEILEQRIEELKDLDIVWCGMNYFNPSETILNKINKSFNIVFDCSTVHNTREYELGVRIPRLTKYLERNRENKYICTRTDRDNLCDLRNKLGLDFNSKYKEQIIYVEDLGIDPNPFCVSLHLYLACLIKFNPKKIILFGADGGGELGNSIESYYKWELIKDDKISCGNLNYNMVGDSSNVNSTYEPLMRNIFGYVPEIINCSPKSLYTIFKKLDYKETINYLKDEV